MKLTGSKASSRVYHSQHIRLNPANTALTIQSSQNRYVIAKLEIQPLILLLGNFDHS